MVERFGSKEAELIATGITTKATLRVLPRHLHEKARMRIDFLLRVRAPQACSVFPGFKMLRGRLRGTYQFDIGTAYRIRFKWGEDRAVDITLGDFHDDDKR